MDRLTAEEAEALGSWLEGHAEYESTVPGIERLGTFIKRSLEHGRIGPGERDRLLESVERVMPKQEREVAESRRRDAREEDEARAARDAVAAEESREKAMAGFDQSRLIAQFDFMVEGITHEAQADIIEKHVRVGDAVSLVRDPGGMARYVRLTNGMDIGHLPSQEAIELAPLLDQGALQSASVKKLLRGRDHLIPVVWGELYEPGADQPRPPTAPTPTKASGCLGALAMVGVVAAAQALAASVW